MQRHPAQEPINPSSPSLELSDACSEQSAKAFETATDAFKVLLDEGVIAALTNTYPPSMNLIEALLDAVKENGEFSWIRSAKLAGAISIGGLASIFTLNPVASSINAVQDVWKEKTGMDVRYNNIITRTFQVAAISGVCTLASYSGYCLIERYCGHRTKAQEFLQYQDATCVEKTKFIGRKSFDLLCAMAANVPTFLFVKQTNLYLAIFAALANVSVSWLGVSGLPLTPGKMNPARREELAYLNEQLITFLKLPKADQQAIMADLANLQREENSDLRYKQLYARMLTLAKPVGDANLKVQAHHAHSIEDTILMNALGAYCTMGGLYYSEATYVGITQQFSDSSSPLAITFGTIAGLFSVLPNGGFGFIAGKSAATALLSEDVPLATLYVSKTREFLKYTIALVSLFGGGASLAVAISASADVAKLTKMSSTLSEILTVLTGVNAYTTAVISLTYYTQRLCDEILTYLAQRCANEDTRKLFTFVLAMRRTIAVLAETNDENYMELLKWKMRGNTELSNLMHVVFDNRMNVTNYDRLQVAMNDDEIIVKNRQSLPHYQVIPSFFAKEAEAMQRGTPTMRQRARWIMNGCRHSE